FNDMTLQENLLVPAVRMQLPWKEAVSRADELLISIGMADRRHQPASELSGGERQLLQFARAIFNTPRLIILDEPFAGSSQDVVNLMLDRIRALAERGTAALVISHDIVSLPRLCGDVIVLVDGAILTQGPFELIRENLQVIEAYLGA